MLYNHQLKNVLPLAVIRDEEETINAAPFVAANGVGSVPGTKTRRALFILPVLVLVYIYVCVCVCVGRVRERATVLLLLLRYRSRARVELGWVKRAQKNVWEFPWEVSSFLRLVQFSNAFHLQKNLQRKRSISHEIYEISFSSILMMLVVRSYTIKILTFIRPINQR